MALLFQILASLVMADVAMPILVFISFVELPSALTKDPRYLKSFTSSSICPLIVMFGDGKCLWLLTRILLFSALISMPYALAASSSLVVICWSSPSRFSYKVDVILKVEVGDGSSPDGNGGVEFLECFFHDVLQAGRH